jgi:tetratricopeptide (TPR) repeat protein
MTLDAIDRMLTEVGDESLAHVPQMESVRKELLQNAIDLQQQLLRSKPSHRTLRIEFARAQHRIGNLHELLGEHPQAEAAYRAAIDQFERLRGPFVDDHLVRHYLAVSHTMLGEVFREIAPDRASRQFRTALRIQEALYRSAPENRDYQLELSRTLNNLGLLLMETGKYAEAETALNGAISHLQNLAKDANPKPAHLCDLGRSHINLGVLLRRQPQRTAEAESAYREAIRNLQRLVRLDRDNRDYQFRLAVAMVDLGNLCMDRDVEEGHRWTSRANAVFHQLCDNFRGIPLYRYELANSHSSVANALARLNKLADARRQFDQANAALDQLAADFPNYPLAVAEFSSLKGRVLGGVGWLQSGDGDLAASQTSVESAIAHQSRAVELAPDNPEFVKLLGAHYNFLAVILRKLGQLELAEAEAAKAKALQRKADDTPGASGSATPSR